MGGARVCACTRRGQDSTEEASGRVSAASAALRGAGGSFDGGRGGEGGSREAGTGGREGDSGRAEGSRKSGKEYAWAKRTRRAYIGLMNFSLIG
jgi:hypothetical protein